jgi:guanylate kinase
VDEFRRRQQAGEFLECKEVFGRGDWYGTLASEVASGLQAGKWVVLEIDVEGAATVVQQYPQACTIFIHPGSLEELEHRLRQRGTEDERSIQRRLEVARHEMARRDQYRYQVVNRTIDGAVQEIRNLLIQAGE